MGAMGTFILTFFSPNAPGRLYLVLFAWAIAFFYIYYGLFNFFRRRAALRAGQSRVPEAWDDPHAPTLVAGGLFVVVVVIVIYSAVTGQVPSKGAWKRG